MSEDDRTSQPVTDLSGESAAGAVQGALVGADANAADVVDNYNKSGSDDNANTALTGAVGSFEDKAEKVQKTDLEVKGSIVEQEAVEQSRADQRAPEVSSAIKESTAKIASAIEESTAEFSRAIQESAAELSSAFQEKAAQLLNTFQEKAARWLIAFEKAAEVTSTIQDTSKFSRSVQETAADISSAIQRAAVEMSSDLQKEASYVVQKAEVSSPVQKAEEKSSSVTQEAAAEHAAEVKEEDGSQSYPPNTGNCTSSITSEAV